MEPHIDPHKQVTAQPHTPHAHARDTAEKKADFLIHLEDTRGVTSTAAVRANVGRRTVYDWINQDEVFADAVREIKYEFSVDWAESKVVELADGVAVFTDDGVVYQTLPDIRALQMFLGARGQERGYGQKQKIALSSSEQGNNGSSANGRAKLVGPDFVFHADDGLSVTTAEFLESIEAVGTIEELKTFHDLLIRARKHVVEQQRLKKGMGEEGGSSWTDDDAGGDGFQRGDDGGII